MCGLVSRREDCLDNPEQRLEFVLVDVGGVENKGLAEVGLHKDHAEGIEVTS